MAELVVMYFDRDGTNAYKKWDVVNTYPDGTLVEPPAPFSPSQPFVFVKSPGLSYADSRQFIEPEIIGTDPTGDPIYGRRRAWTLEGQRLPKADRDALDLNRQTTIAWSTLADYIKRK